MMPPVDPRALAHRGRAVFFTESSNNIGGQELQILQQAQGLQQLGYIAVVVCRPESRICEEAGKKGIPVELVGFRNALHVPSFVRLLRLFKRTRPLAIVCHSGHDSNLSALAVHILRKLRLLKPGPRLLRVRTYQPGLPKSYTYNCLFDHTLVCSASLRQQLLANPAIRPSRISVLYPGVAFESIARAAQQPLPSETRQCLIENPDSPTLLMVHAAMFRQEKGHQFMLGVFKELVIRFPGLRYLAAGEGALRIPFLNQVRAMGLNKHVFAPGMVNPVAPLLARANVVVMPSLYEPLGMSQIEALSLNVPVVVSEVGGLPETVQGGKTGWVCPAPSRTGAQEAWVQALTQVLDNSQEASRRAGLGRQAVLAQFDLQSNLQGLIGHLHGAQHKP